MNDMACKMRTTYTLKTYRESTTELMLNFSLEEIMLHSV